MLREFEGMRELEMNDMDRLTLLEENGRPIYIYTAHPAPSLTEIFLGLSIFRRLFFL
jgi:hypothetical protein